jgi:Domain of unknown function (DUF3597)
MRVELGQIAVNCGRNVMSIFSSIIDKIFRRDADGAPSGRSSSAGTQKAPSATKTAGSAAQAASGPKTESVDVEAVLSGMATKKGQRLDWQHSIVDLMKLLDLDSSLAARKELAKELNYSCDSNDFAKMNVWLHKQVMQKLAENGGKVPESLRA